ncbi:MAG: C40 family peptidase [Nocardioides sp.]|nr:C40 family peptidase [Nocardioidaceae bacterium]MCB8956156.1 C40 family peptidase [Nocardioides sp.]
MLKGRKRLVTLLSGTALVAAVGFMPSTPASAEPDIDTVQARVDRLYRDAEQASERYNDAKLELQSLKRDLGLLKADQGRQDQRLEAVRQQVQDSIIRQYEGQDLAAMGRVVVSDDPQKFLSQLSTMSAYNDMQDQLFDDYATELKSLDIRSDATAKRAAQVAELEKRLGAEKATVDENLSEAKTLLGELQAKQREQMLSRGTVTRTAPVAASGRAGAAVAYAMAQVGKAYVYGAAGPSAFDCSGLTMMAWAQAGVSLPHSSSAQYSSGPHVAESDLQPGDLVFYYSPISHVGMYIGNGMIVNAENPSSGIRVTSLHAMPYVGAVRPG